MTERDVAAAGEWAPGPERPTLADGAVHVWRADLHSVSDDLGDLLCAEERARAERFPRERERMLWSRSRGVLRTLLGRYLGVDARELRFRVGEHGKPALAGAQISFNLSHSDDLALYAFAATAAVGVDVERPTRSFDMLAVAARMFSQREAEHLRDLPEHQRQRAFLRAWTRHEAELKCSGVGIGGARTVAARPAPWLAELDVGPHAAGAVAVAAQPRELRRWIWR